MTNYIPRRFSVAWILGVTLLAAAGCAHVHAQSRLAVRVQSAASPEPSSPRRPSIQDLVAMRIHHVTPEFVRQVRDIYPDATIDDIVGMRIHNVTLAFVDQARYAFSDVSPQDLIAMQIHHVTFRFADEVRAIYPDATVQDLISMRIHHVTIDQLRDAQ